MVYHTNMSGLLTSFKQFCTNIPSLTPAQVEHMKADPERAEFFAQFAGSSRATRYLFRTLLKGLGAPDDALHALIGSRAVGRPRKNPTGRNAAPIPAGEIEPAILPAGQELAHQEDAPQEEPAYQAGAQPSLLSVTGDSIRSLLDLFLDLAAGVDGSQKAQAAHALLGVLRERLAHAEP